MKTTLTTTQGKILVSNASPEDANLALRAIHKRGKHSDIVYQMQLSDGHKVTGSIDMEPASFHAQHQREIFSRHIKTYWGNVSKATVKQYPYLTQGYIDQATEIYNKILKEI